MADAILSTATTNFTSTVQSAIQKTLTELLRYECPWLIPGVTVTDSYMSNAGKNYTFTHESIGEMAAAKVVALSEGVTPETADLALTVESFTAAQRGGVIKITDRVAMQSAQNLLRIAVERAARAGQVDADNLAKAIWSTGSASEATAGHGLYFSDATTPQANAAKSSIIGGTDVLQLRDIQKAVGYLRLRSVAPVKDGCYVLIASPRALAALKVETASGGWLDIAKYADPTSLLKGEVGTVFGCKVIETPNGIFDETGGAASAPVEKVIIAGKGAIAFSDVSSVEGTFIPPVPSADDPLGQRAYAGFKYIGGGMLLEGAEGRGRYAAIWTSAPVL